MPSAVPKVSPRIPGRYANQLITAHMTTAAIATVFPVSVTVPKSEFTAMNVVEAIAPISATHIMVVSIPWFRTVCSNILHYVN